MKGEEKSQVGLPYESWCNSKLYRIAREGERFRAAKGGTLAHTRGDCHLSCHSGLFIRETRSGQAGRSDSPKHSKARKGVSGRGKKIKVGGVGIFGAFSGMVPAAGRGKIGTMWEGHSGERGSQKKGKLLA